MVCNECQSIFQGQLKAVETPSERFLSPTAAHWKEGLDQYCGIIEKSFKDICRSSAQCCYICDLLQQDATQYWIRLSRRFGTEFALTGPDSYPDGIWNLRWTVAFDGDSLSLAIDVRVAKEFGIEASQAKWLEPYFALTPLPDNENSNSALSVIPQPRSRMQYALKWLKDCNTTHPQCNERAENIAYPSRLLKLSSPQSSFLQLKDTEKSNIQGPYMTLSHRWGTAQFLRLTTETSKELYEGIEVTKLARTFQDAAVVARTLGALYLWIDSLCIFQDSAEDWKKESSIMGDIYAGGALNIAAIAPGDSNATTFSFGRRGVQINENSEITTLWHNRKNARYKIHRRWPWKEDVDDMPLMLRGWVVQERILSPRILYLGKRQVYWECQQLQACQVFPKGVPDAYFSRYPVKRAIPTRWKRQNLGYLVTEEGESCGGTIRDFHKCWSNALTLYTMCDLTRSSDKLIALSGIARTCGEGLRDSYAAGIWRSNLPIGLLWARDYHTYCSRTETYLAPSWSWASVMGSVKFPPDSAPDKAEMALTSGECFVSVVELKVTTSWDDKFGPVNGGYVRLSGPLWTIELIEGSTVGSRSGAQITHYSWIHINGTKVDQEDFSKCSHGLRLDYELDSISNLHFMPFVSRPTQDDRVIETWGLVLQPINVCHGHFRRVGLLYIRTQECLCEFIFDGSRTVTNASWFQYQSIDHQGRYTIMVE